MSEFLRYVLWELRRNFLLAFLAGLFALAVLGVSCLVYRRKYGGQRAFPWKKSLLFVVFIGYLAIVIFATLFRVNYMNREVNLHLFRAWREALNNFSQHLWLNVLLNIAMFCPLGFLLPTLNRKFRAWYFTIPAGFGFSLLIELVQLGFGRGVFDVDDLFCNTLGAAIGFFAGMAFLSILNKRWKPVAVYTCLMLCSLGAVGSVFVAYHVKEFGNLPQQAAYRVNTRETEWSRSCVLPEVGDSLPVYQTETRTIEDCDAFAEEFKQIIPTEFEDISYYQEAAYYMDHGNGDGAHFLFVNYLDQGYDYTAIYDTDPVWTEADRETILKALEKYPLQIPETAEFIVDGDGWHRFQVSQYADGENVYDGVLRVRYGADGLVREIENRLLCYSYYRDVAVISPEEAYQRLQAGRFNDEGYFAYKKPAQVTVLSCGLAYRVDTKGFYQPVYVFDVSAPDGSYQDQILIPAMK